MKCQGCGSILQTQDAQRVGYINSVHLQEDKKQYCKRCFDLLHYNFDQFQGTNNDALFQILKDIQEKDNTLVVYVYDPILEVSFPQELMGYLKDQKVFLVGTKFDLLKEQYPREKIEKYIHKYVQKFDMNVVGNTVISNKDKTDIRKLFVALRSFEKERIYVIGASNVGKSSMINGMIQLFLKDRNLITTSHRIGTTLFAIEILFPDLLTLIDTPGYIDTHSFPFHLQSTSLLLAQVKGKIRPKIYQLQPEQSIFVEGLFRVDFLSGEATSFVFYGADSLYVHRTKLENADDFFAKNQFTLLQIPNKEEVKGLGEILPNTFTCRHQEKTDIVFSGIGYLSILGEVKVRIHTYQNIQFHIRKDWL